jgi:hypothetical protein
VEPAEAATTSAALELRGAFSWRTLLDAVARQLAALRTAGTGAGPQSAADAPASQADVGAWLVSVRISTAAAFPVQMRVAPARRKEGDSDEEDGDDAGPADARAVQPDATLCVEDADQRAALLRFVAVGEELTGARLSLHTPLPSAPSTAQPSTGGLATASDTLASVEMFVERFGAGALGLPELAVRCAPLRVLCSATVLTRVRAGATDCCTGLPIRPLRTVCRRTTSRGCSAS